MIFVTRLLQVTDPSISIAGSQPVDFGQAVRNICNITGYLTN